MTTVTRDPETLPTIGSGYHAIPWHPQPSIFEAMEVQIVTADGVRTVTHEHVEAMLATDRTHAGFCSRLVLRSPLQPDVRMVGLWSWIDWQRTRDPLRADLPAMIAFAEARAIERAAELAKPAVEAARTAKKSVPRKASAKKKPAADGEASS